MSSKAIFYYLYFMYLICLVDVKGIQIKHYGHTGQTDYGNLFQCVPRVYLEMFVKYTCEVDMAAKLVSPLRPLFKSGGLL